MLMKKPNADSAAADLTESEPQQVGAGINYTDPNSPWAPFYVRTSHILFACLLVGIYLLFEVLTPLGHTDIWGHLKFGQWIVEHRTLPDKEPFSLFSDPTQSYWNFQWLSQVTFYLTYRAGALLAKGDELRQTAGGVEMLRTLHGLTITLKFAFLTLAAWRSTRSLPLAIVVSLVMLLVAFPSSSIQRPQVFAEVFFAMLIWWVSGPQLSRYTFIFVPILFTVWANFHGSFLIGYVFLGLFCTGKIIETLVGRVRPWRQILRVTWLWHGLAALALAPLAIGLLNPHGFEIYENVLQLSRHPNLRTLSEWGALGFSLTDGGSIIFLAILVLIVLAQCASPRPLSISRLLVLLAFALGSLYQQRILIWLIMITPWVIAPLLKHALVYLPKSWLHVHSIPSLRKTMMVGALMLIGFSWSGLFQLIMGRDPMPLSVSVTHATLWQVAMELKHGDTMPELADALKTYPQKRFQGRIFVQDNLSDYLLWSLPAKAPLLLYNHAHLFPEEIWQHQITILTAGPGWSSLVDHYRVNLIAFDPSGWPELASELRTDPAWHVVVDEGEADAAPQAVAVQNMKLFIAVRKKPI